MKVARFNEKDNPGQPAYTDANGRDTGHRPSTKPVMTAGDDIRVGNPRSEVGQGWNGRNRVSAAYRQSSLWDKMGPVTCCECGATTTKSVAYFHPYTYRWTCPSCAEKDSIPLIVVDDPIHEGENVPQSEVNEWFDETMAARALRGGDGIVIQARAHEAEDESVAGRTREIVTWLNESRVRDDGTRDGIFDIRKDVIFAPSRTHDFDLPGKVSDSEEQV